MRGHLAHSRARLLGSSGTIQLVRADLHGRHAVRDTNAATSRKNRRAWLIAFFLLRPQLVKKVLIHSQRYDGRNPIVLILDQLPHNVQARVIGWRHGGSRHQSQMTVTVNQARYYRFAG